MAKIAEKEEKNPGKDVHFTVTELNTLLRWKWEAVEEHQRPKYSVLKCNSGIIGNANTAHVLHLSQPDYELYVDGVGVEQVFPDPHLHPVPFPSTFDTQGDTQEDIENDNPDDDVDHQPFQRQFTGLWGML